jgi:hypothetical protein
LLVNQQIYPRYHVSPLHGICSSVLIVSSVVATEEYSTVIFLNTVECTLFSYSEINVEGNKVQEIYLNNDETLHRVLHASDRRRNM